MLIKQVKQNTGERGYKKISKEQVEMEYISNSLLISQFCGRWSVVRLQNFQPSVCCLTNTEKPGQCGVKPAGLFCPKLTEVSAFLTMADGERGEGKPLGVQRDLGGNVVSGYV